MEQIMLNPFIYRSLCVPLVLLLHTTQGLSQQITTPVGAEQWMLGGCSSTLTNVFSANNNPAAIAQIKHFQIGLNSETRFFETRLQTSNISAVKPVRSLTLGASINYFGYSAFNQQRISLAASKELTAHVSLGVQLNYISTFIQDFGTTGNITLGLGLYAKTTKDITLSFVLFNPTQSKYGKHTTEQIPTYAQIGFNYLLSDKIKLLAQADQQLNEPLVLRCGMYYQIHSVFNLAMGAASNPSVYTFGLGLKAGKIKLDLAASFHQVLGFTPHVSIIMPMI